MIWWSAWIAILLTFSFVACTDLPDPDGVKATVVVNIPGSPERALALREVIVLILNASHVPAKGTRVREQCVPADYFNCTRAVARALINGRVSVAVTMVPAEQAYRWRPNLVSVEEMNEIAPPMRRACVTTSKGPARSLLDLSDANIAAAYDVLGEQDARDINNSNCQLKNCTFTPTWCTGVPCATLLTSEPSEAEVLTDVIKNYNLFATVTSLGVELENVTLKLENYSIIACDFAPEISLAELNYTTLSPPPCISEDCPFESRRLMQYVYQHDLAHEQTAMQALAKLNINKSDFRKLGVTAQLKGYKEAAKEYFKAHKVTPYIKFINVAALLPITTDRQFYDARALRSAAAVAEHDANNEWRNISLPTIFKVEATDDECQITTAIKYLDVVKSRNEYPFLSAVVGPACGAPWSDMARKTSTHHIPTLAFTPQVPIAGSSSNGPQVQLLAAGDSREWISALLALMADKGWRRVGALYELATHPLIVSVREYAEFAVTTELPEGGQFDTGKATDWASRAAKANARIMFVCVEDARIIRQLLCASRLEGLTPDAGVVWLICRRPPENWLHPGINETCTKEQLEEMAAGYFTVTPEWQLTWEEKQSSSTEINSWEKRWRTHCRNLPQNDPPACRVAKPTANSALLYDVIVMWSRAVGTFLSGPPPSNLHDPDYVSKLIQFLLLTEYNGLTGHFDWTIINKTPVRRTPLVLSQWDPKLGSQVIGRWNGDNLTLDDSSLRWYTSDGRLPDDGSEHCTLQQFADALNSDCRTAYIALSTILVIVLLIILGSIAYQCKRRADQQYKERLAALGMRPIAIKPNGLDRWEIPRERVVINRKLGTGAFGTVYGGHALLAEDKGWSAVAVKTLKAGATTEEKLDFLSEAEAMKRFDHKNVVRLLGVVTKTEPVCTVMEFMLYGDLKNYLLARRHLAMGCGSDDEAGGEADEASPKRLTGMALDVARALSYLAQLRYVHRDVAARNCLVSARRVVKLADFGMTRLVFENDYYRFSRKGMLPVRWMAPESLALGVFSPASDVWSFGVLLYEIVTFGSLPFQGFSNSEVLSRVKAGHTLELPPGLKPQLEGLIKSCWQQDSKCRPTASEVAAFLADAPRLLSPCLDIPLDALPLDADPPWKLPREQAEARWVSWAAPASTATDTTYLSTEGNNPLETDSFLS